MKRRDFLKALATAIGGAAMLPKELREELEALEDLEPEELPLPDPGEVWGATCATGCFPGPVPT